MQRVEMSTVSVLPAELCRLPAGGRRSARPPAVPALITPFASCRTNPIGEPRSYIALMGQRVMKLGV